MDYIIREVMVGQILVEFSSGDQAVIGISPTDTPEDIDHLVSFFDPEFLPEPETQINTNVRVGEERSSSRRPPAPQTPPGPPERPNLPPLGYTPLSDPLLFYMASHYASQGDNTLMDKLHESVVAHYGDTDVQSIIDAIDETNDVLNDAQLNLEISNDNEGTEEIYRQAMMELGEEV